MKILVNTSNLVKGGAVQVALSFLEELKEWGTDEYFVFLSTAVAAQLDLNTFPSNFAFYHFPISPARLRTRWRIVRQFNELEREINPEVVFTVFGPSYWRPRSPHVMGFALVWAINPESIAYTRLDKFGLLRMKLINLYAKYFVKRDGDFFIGETNDVKERMVRYKWAVSDQVFVVGNTYHKAFSEDFEKCEIPIYPEEFRLITISAMYKHKNITILKDVIPYLRSPKIRCRFYLTLPLDTFEREFYGCEDMVTNIGPVLINQCPSIYEQCDALFLPTLLECFSASYPEAMKMELPILTSDLDFAHSICGDAAEYFDPLNPEDIAWKIENIIKNADLRKELINNGKKRLATFPSAQQRARMYLDICKSVAQQHFNSNPKGH
jgi:glycosyltransferase involved in cell wall biosynthesis